MKNIPKYLIISFIVSLLAQCTKPSFVQVLVNTTHLSSLDVMKKNKVYHNNQGDTVFAMFSKDSTFVEANKNSKGIQVNCQQINYTWRIETLNLNLGATLEALPDAEGLSKGDVFTLFIDQQVRVATTFMAVQGLLNCDINCSYLETLEVYGIVYNQVFTAQGVITPRLYYNLTSGIFAFETLDRQLYQLVN